MATHSSILAWKIPRTEEPGRLQSMSRKELGTTEWLSMHARIHILPSLWASLVVQIRRPGFDPWVRMIPWRRKAKHCSILAWRIPCTEKLRSLVGYSPWCCKESDTTEQLTLSLYQFNVSLSLTLLNSIRKGILNFIKCFLTSIEKIIISFFPLPSYSYSELQ